MNVGAAGAWAGRQSPPVKRNQAHVSASAIPATSPTMASTYPRRSSRLTVASSSTDLLFHRPAPPSVQGIRDHVHIMRYRPSQVPGNTATAAPPFRILHRSSSHPKLGRVGDQGPLTWR